MKTTINKLQEMCYDINNVKDGKYYAFCTYSGHVDLITIGVCLRSNKQYKRILDENVFMRAETNVEYKLQNLITLLKKYK